MGYIELEHIYFASLGEVAELHRHQISELPKCADRGVGIMNVAVVSYLQPI